MATKRTTSTPRTLKRYKAIREAGGRVTTVELSKEGVAALERGIKALGATSSATIERALVQQFPVPSWMR